MVRFYKARFFDSFFASWVLLAAPGCSWLLLAAGGGRYIAGGLYREGYTRQSLRGQCLWGSWRYIAGGPLHRRLYKAKPQRTVFGGAAGGGRYIAGGLYREGYTRQSLRGQCLWGSQRYIAGGSLHRRLYKAKPQRTVSGGELAAGGI